MKRRIFLSGAAAAGATVAASALPKPALAQKKVEAVMVTTWPRDFPGLGTGAQ
ncbi:MAG: ABC transporter substrate-binding protein, partial [Rhodospirillaceae bacterium]|nr:ABC transporter substrate-binding protein [Rhodospirillaceae bacterium]